MVGALLPINAWSSGTAFASPSSKKPDSVATVTGARMVRENGIAAVEIVSTEPLVPTIQSLDSPPRIVIDLHNAKTQLKKKRVNVLQDDILTMRMEEYQ